jgi:hypothetical protein
LDGPKASAAINGPLYLKYRKLEKANATAYCLEIQLISQDSYEENHKGHKEARVEPLLKAVGNHIPRSSTTLRRTKANKFVKVGKDL